VPVGGALALHTAIQGDQIVGQWVRAPNSAPGVPSSSSVPAAKQEGFIAEARGTGPTVNADCIPPCMLDILNPSSAPQVQASGIAVESKGRDRSLRLETYLLQFRQLATYLQCTERDTFYNMSASLAGPAARVLWELPKDATTADLERILQTRFGTEQQTASYQAKLRARRREINEPLQDLYQDISHLLQLAYPGEGGSIHFACRGGYLHHGAQ